MRRSNFVMGMLVVFLLGLTAAGCENSGNLKAPRPDPVRGGPAQVQGKLFGEDGLTLYRSGGKTEASSSGSGIGVNAFLWRATLDTISFVPLSSADPFGGVIITDWVRSAREPRRALQDDGLHPRQGAACGRRASRRLSPATRRGRPVGGSSHEPGHCRQPRKQDSRPRQTTARLTTRLITSPAPNRRPRGAAAPARPSCYRDAALRRRPERGSERCR